MPGPVPGPGSPSLHPSSGFFVQELREFVVVVVVIVKVVVALWVADWKSATVSASAVFLWWHREMAAVLAVVLEGA